MARIYVSSTFVDLNEYRQKVSQAIRRAGHDDVAMEYYVAEDKRPVDRCLADVSRCDLYVGIFAWRYGWVPRVKNRKRLSITEMEYRQALVAGKECLIFLLDASIPWPPDWIDEDRTRIKRLRNDLAEQHGGDVFKSVAELGQCVSEAFHKWTTRTGGADDGSISQTRRSVSFHQFLDDVSQGSRFDSSAVDAFRSLLKPERRRDFPLSLQPPAFLERNGLLINGSLTRTGVLLFHSNPDTELVSAYVQCAVFDGEQKRKPKITEDIRGTVHGQITGVIGFVRRYTEHIDHFAAGPGRTIRLDQYPMGCLREVLANAACHRDYSDTHRNIHLRIFPDRIEILSPGEWMGATRIDGRVELSVVRSESITRNTTLAKLLSWIRYVEREGSGIQRALADCVAKDAPLPTIEKRDGFVVVALFPSQRFRRAARGESEDDVATKAEVIEAVEDEQFAYINSRSSALDKLAALRAFARRDVRSAHRVLGQLSDLPPAVALSFLREETGWDGDDLRAYVSNWIYQDNTNAELLRLLLEFAGAARDVRAVAYVYYAILGNKLPIEKGDFFRTCWRPMSSDLRIQTVVISGADGPVSFVMGSDDRDAPDDECPAHEVELSAYRIGRTPVTCKEYGAFTGETSNAMLPIVSVTWWEAWLFCEWLGGALPTEAQWECACRAGTTTGWWTGDDERVLPQAAWVDEGDDDEAHPVGQKAANPWGLFDVHGNVSEWCLDLYGPYVAGKQVDPSGPKSGHTRVLRGGNAAAPADRSRSASRDQAVPHSTSLVAGFRVAFSDASPLV